MAKKYKSIFISDVHLGSKGSQADALCRFLKKNSCENLYLVGDIIDGWRLSKKWYFPQSHANVIRRILTAAKRDTNVYYIIGNHDEVLRKYLSFDISFGSIKVSNQCDYIGVDGKRYLVIHGDAFDRIMLTSKWLMHIGDTFYNALISLNTMFNKVRKFLRMNYWSLSKYLKHKTKRALNYIHHFEDIVAEHCEKEGYDGIICGHIHTPEIKQIGNIVYMNSGDWVESCSALVEHYTGEWELIHFQENNNVKNTINN